MKILSYAQNHEDVVLDRVFPRGKPGFYIDVGANEPVRGSVTKHFYDLGWHGINIEPAASAYELLSQARERDLNLNVALSDVEGEQTLYEFPAKFSGGSTFSEVNAERLRQNGLPYVERKVPVMTLARLCEDNVEGTIDFLSVDVEGHELEVLQGGDWRRWRPRVVLVEATEPNTTVSTHSRWEHVLFAADYVFALFDGLNRYYVRREDEDLVTALSVPANINDGYVAYEHLNALQDQLCVIDDLRAAAEASVRRETAARAVSEALRQELVGVVSEVGLLRSNYERLERALTVTRSHLESLRGELGSYQTTAAENLAHTEARFAEAVAAQAGDATPDGSIPEGVSPASLGVARRLTAISSRHPLAAKSAKSALRTALKVKRSIANR